MKKQRKLIAMILVFAIITSNFGIINTYAEDTVTIAMRSCPNIDIVATTGVTETNMNTFANDIKNALYDKGIAKEKVNVQLLETTEHEITESFTWQQDLSSSIGSISITDGGKDVVMKGNQTNPGKNAMWYFPENGYKYNINFGYNIAFGDSFNCAGLLLRVTQNGNTLTGYMLTFNNPSSTSYSSCYSLPGTTAAIWKFNWEIGTNSSNIISFKHIRKFGSRCNRSKNKSVRWWFIISCNSSLRRRLYGIRIWFLF